MTPKKSPKEIAQPTLIARNELFDAGKRLRQRTSRKSQATYKPLAARPDPVDILTKSNKGRLPELIPIRHGRMLVSPFTFYRGAAAIMAADLAHTPSNGITLQACGDCHLLNFGGFGTPERRVIFDINDFDETHPAPWEWDLKRLAASFVIAGRNNGLSKLECREATQATVRSYRERMLELAEMNVLEAWYASIDAKALIETTQDPEMLKMRRKRLKKAISKTSAEANFPKLVEEKDGRTLFKDDPPFIYHADKRKFPDVARRIHDGFKMYRDSLPHERRVLYDRYSLADSAVKVVGIGSVGTICLVALFFSKEGDPLILQIKEARPSVLEPYSGKSKFKNHGQRVVVGQRIMQAASDIFLGWARSSRGKDFYIRQLNDLKLKPLVEIFNAQHLAEYGGACGWALARAHARSGTAALLSGYMGKSDVLDEAVADFAEAYADQNERDYGLFKKAVRAGRIEVMLEQ
ncbi:DUF2252 domain-containing protein [bacterium]|nr:MAG: DUF2252 domain-containing protein [bacterium]